MSKGTGEATVDVALRDPHPAHPPEQATMVASQR
jgi:hypothetical protein